MLERTSWSENRFAAGERIARCRLAGNRFQPPPNPKSRRQVACDSAPSRNGTTRRTPDVGQIRRKHGAVATRICAHDHQAITDSKANQFLRARVVGDQFRSAGSAQGCAGSRARERKPLDLGSSVAHCLCDRFSEAGRAAERNDGSQLDRVRADTPGGCSDAPALVEQRHRRFCDPMQPNGFRSIQLVGRFENRDFVDIPRGYRTTAFHSPRRKGS